MAKIYIFSGDDIVSSRDAYIQQIESFKKQNYDVETVPVKDITLEVLENILGSCDLFGNNRCLATEKFFSGKPSELKDRLIEKILSFEGATFIDWEEKEISKTQAEEFGKSLILKNFKLPSFLFKFLNSISPENKKENVLLLKKVLENLESGFVFSMIVRQVRLLILISGGECQSMAPWQKRNLENQSKHFSKEKLISLYKELLEIDYRQKTSSSPFGLNSELEFFITNL